MLIPQKGYRPLQGVPFGEVIIGVNVIQVILIFEYCWHRSGITLFDFLQTSTTLPFNRHVLHQYHSTVPGIYHSTNQLISKNTKIQKDIYRHTALLIL